MHQSVLLNEVIESLGVCPGGIYVDGTVGSGGHAEAILRASSPDGRLIAIDRDVDAVGRSGGRLSVWGERCRIIHSDYGDLKAVVNGMGIAEVNGVLLDLGVSSEQLDTPGRGFSFQSEGPLDMRMDQGQSLTAAQVVNTWPETVLADTFYQYAQETRSRRIARAIVEARSGAPIATTSRLADVVARACGGRTGKIHPATRVFQALRMAVNDEMGILVRGLESGLQVLANGGRMVVISFHSGEDRCVKTCFREHAGRWESLPQGGSAWVGRRPAVKWVHRRVVVASENEREDNPRARSAKLRVVERDDRCGVDPTV
ncbi:MAG: 16S rRNA (cytosine(1402)-N(4))-methyltransferase [Lentisphaerae bacterium RIFOXYC12_FULL_60_16]|nr:MAG: 16S rRNA (cytosine(1402)-N(4))-methyltransferase [Lentisphaerae bacterium RIFOXYC12_FULL_60_16]